MRMENRSVLIVGDSLFAETLNQMLVGSGCVTVIGTAPTVQAALLILALHRPDAVIVAGDADSAIFAQLLSLQPDIALLCAGLNDNRVQVFSSQYIDASVSNLLATIAALPRRAVV